MRIINNFTDFLSRPSEKGRSNYTLPEAVRIKVLVSAGQILNNHPWAQQINIEQNHIKIDKAVKQLTPGEPVSTNLTTNQSLQGLKSKAVFDTDIERIMERINGLHDAE